jgi:hypothetical protein
MREFALSKISSQEPFVPEEEQDAAISSPETASSSQPATQPATQSAPSTETAP